jgi:hypothetical protein
MEDEKLQFMMIEGRKAAEIAAAEQSGVAFWMLRDEGDRTRDGDQGITGDAELD